MIVYNDNAVFNKKYSVMTDAKSVLFFNVFFEYYVARKGEAGMFTVSALFARLQLND